MRIKSSIIALAVVVALTACEKDDFGYKSQNHPPAEVTVENRIAMVNGVPVVSGSISGGGTVEFKLSIPSGSGRTIKEITSVGLHNSNANYKDSFGPYNPASANGLYTTAPIAVNATTVTYTTTFAAYTAKTGLAVTTGGTATSYLARYFYFKLTLDNGEVILAIPVRVYIKP